MENHSPPCTKLRYNCNCEIVVPVKCVKCSCTGNRNHLHFIWRMLARLNKRGAEE